MMDLFNPGKSAREHWPRGSKRQTVEAEVSFRKPGQIGYQVRLFDLSPRGCKVEFVERPNPHDRVWVKFRGLEGIPAYVCWIDGFTGGVEFEQSDPLSCFRPIVDAATVRSPGETGVGASSFGRSQSSTRDDAHCSLAAGSDAAWASVSRSITACSMSSEQSVRSS